MSLADAELWAFAQNAVSAFGDGALKRVEEHVHYLILGGDEEGAWTWLAVADRIKALTALPSDEDSRH